VVVMRAGMQEYVGCWLNPRGPLILCGLHCGFVGFVGFCGACWPSGLAAWLVPLAPLIVSIA
jgi:hypothetical protein